MKRATECLFFLVVASILLFFTVAPRYDLLGSRAAPYVLQKRQLPTTNPAQTSTTPTTPTSPASTEPTATPTQPTTPTQPLTTQTSTTPTQTSQQPSTQPQATSATPTSQQQTTATSVPNTSTTPLSVANSQSQTQTITETSTSATGTDNPSATSAPSSPPSGSGGGGGLGTGSIIGLSVAGGVALIGIVGFFIWKFTRKRFTDFDDNEAIKWPELNTHGEGSINHALPTNSTGRSGFGDEGDGLSRAPSTGYANSVGASSAQELYPGAGNDPYAVPPLPHLNPNQPYHDDPNYGQTEFYDPYRGPVPESMSMDGHPGVQGYGGEAIPMTQMAGRRSPGPAMAYDMGRSSPVSAVGRQSPGAQMMMDDRSRSPGPSIGMVPGRLTSPAPHQPYGGGYDNRY